MPRARTSKTLASRRATTAGPSVASLTAFRGRTSIRAKVLRQSVLLVTFCILLLGGLLFHIITSFVTASQLDESGAFYGLRTLEFTVLFMSGLLLVLAFLLSTLLARGLTGALQELSVKVRAIRPGTWMFRQTVRTGDEIEMLDRVVADLTGRLRNAYEYLEEQVADRTRKLREEYALDRAILESIEYGVLAMDQQGVATEANPGACRVLQMERSSVLGKHCRDLLPIVQHKGRAHRTIHPVDAVLEKRSSYHSHPSQHLSLKRRNDEVLPITLLIEPLFRGKKFFGAIAVVQDQSVERQIDYLKSEFISLASHQLRTPLSSIRWYIEMLSNEQGSFSDEHASYLREIDAASKRMANLIEALLHIAKLEEGGLVPHKAQVDAAALLRRTVQEWQRVAKEHHVTVNASIPTGKLPLHTDPLLLGIVLQNLFTNALKYNRNNQAITVTLSAERRHVCITVRDRGLGIPAVEQKRIFQKFFRSRNVREIDTDGTGLGLYMSKTIVENLGGEITFKSTEGKGSEFTVRLPA